jgi:hypothetical protein
MGLNLRLFWGLKESPPLPSIIIIIIRASNTKSHIQDGGLTIHGPPIGILKGERLLLI